MHQKSRDRLRTFGFLHLSALVIGLSCSGAMAQTAPVNGMRPVDLRTHAITGATVIPAPGQKIENATIIIRDGVILAVGPDAAVPAHARVWKAEGLTVYPGLIEPALMIRPEDSPRGAGSHWNARIQPELSMAEKPGPDQNLRKELRGLGFTTAAVYSTDGALRGTGAVIALADENEYVLAYREKAAMGAAFDYGGFGRGGGGGGDGYPGSLMGAIALLRQTLYDAQWYQQCLAVWQQHPQGNEPPTRSDALAALADVISRKQQVLFEVNDEHNAMRAAKLAREFNLDMVLLGSGLEFRRIDDVLATKLPLIVPLEFPRRPEVSTIAAADSVSLRDLMTWEQAPTNARRLINAGATVSLTTHKLRSRNEFHGNLRTAIKHGLTEDQALAALTTTPAKLLGLDHVLGTIEPGKVANLVVVKGSLFDKEGKIHDTWVNGRRYEIFKEDEIQLKGSGELATTRGGEALKVELDTVKNSLSIKTADDKKVNAKKVVVQQDQISFVFDGKPFGVEGYVQFSGVIDSQSSPPTITGNGALPSGETFGFTITVTPAPPTPAKDDKADAEKADAKDTKKQDTGEEQEPDDADQPGPRDESDDIVTGEWTLRLDQMPDMAASMRLKLEDPTTVTGTLNVMGQDIHIPAASFEPSTGKLSFTVNNPQGGPVAIELTIIDDALTGTATSAQFNGVLTGTREGARASNGAGRGKRAEDAPFVMPPEELPLPLSEYGFSAPPQPQNILIHNATIWTAGPKGMIENGWMRIANGKIAEIGNGAAPAGFNEQDLIIDAAGRHITPGLIDCHSHTGIDGGVNEFSQANTAEVRIGDCIDPDDLNWYRELAGGLTACNQLHGSANPIGGQNSVVKLKWGAVGGAAAFPIEDAIPGIKFALGENVKRSQNRYPNTRMGVETFIRDAFTAARDYKAAWDRYRALPQSERARTMPPQRDIELDTLVEILEKKRLVHCHSYRQDEILMLIRVADAFGFTIGTFQHVLEGYKVAEAIAKHGAGGSSFSDWWAYKVEVMDAIPYNGALMTEVGVLTSFNSDSDELARRMNTEAAKAVRYGGMEPHEALKLVTINPAKQLRIDHRTGSLEEGKDADFAIWSGDPLSTYTKCEQTWIEGARYFDLETDLQLRQQVQNERQRIIQKILAEAHGAPGTPGKESSGTNPEAGSDEPAEGRRGRPGSRRPGGNVPDGASDPPSTPPTHRGRLLARMMQERHEWIEDQLRAGRDPDENRPGDCGCNDMWSWMMQAMQE